MRIYRVLTQHPNEVIGFRNYSFNISETACFKNIFFSVSLLKWFPNIYVGFPFFKLNKY